MQTKMPKIANIDLSRVRFFPGDRLIVRVCSDLTDRQRGRLLETVRKFAGCNVEILLVDTRKFDVEVEKACQRQSLKY